MAKCQCCPFWARWAASHPHLHSQQSWTCSYRLSASSIAYHPCAPRWQPCWQSCSNEVAFLAAARHSCRPAPVEPHLAQQQRAHAAVRMMTAGVRRRELRAAAATAALQSRLAPAAVMAPVRAATPFPTPPQILLPSMATVPTCTAGRAGCALYHANSHQNSYACTVHTPHYKILLAFCSCCGKPTPDISTYCR